MELIDRYVNAVGERLSTARRTSVEAELRAAILDALEGRGTGPDDDDAVVEVLREFGEPGRVAASYEPSGQYLIGPELYPMFRRAARWLLGSLAVGGVLTVGVRLLLTGLAETDGRAILAGTIGSLLRAGLYALIVLVVVFFFLQRAEVRLPRFGREWDPRRLSAPPQRDRVSQFDSIVALGASVIAIVIVDGLLRAAVATMARTSSELRELVIGAAFDNLMLIEVVLVITALAHAVALALRRWNAWTRGARLLAEIVALVVFVRLPFQVMAYRGELIASGLGADFVNWLVLNLLLVAALWLAVFVVQQWRAFRRRSADSFAVRGAGRPTSPTAPAARA